MRKAKLTALCGMMTALSVVLMALTTFLPVLMYVLPIITGVAVLVVADVSNKKWGAGVYFATAILSLLLITDKETALTYTLFFGYYPLVRGIILELPKAFSWAVRLVLFNCSAVLIGFSGVYVLGLSAEEYSEFGKATILILLGLSNVVFLMYDSILTKWSIVFKAISHKLKKLLR